MSVTYPFVLIRPFILIFPLFIKNSNLVIKDYLFGLCPELHQFWKSR